MPSTVIRKIPLFASRLQKTGVASLTDEDSSNYFNVANLSTNYIGTNAAGTVNQLKDMFDGYYNTSFRISSDAIEDVGKGQLNLLNLHT